MSIFRNHNIKITVLFLFVTGMIFVAWPWEERAHPGESVAAWLFELRSDTENPDVHDKIHSLRMESGDIPGLLRKASAIIGDHAEDFTLPVDNGTSSDDDIYNTLLLKWSLHQQNAPVDTVMITDRQTSVPQANEKEDKTVWGQFTGSIQLVAGTYSRVVLAWDYVRMLIRPLTSGIAIGAP
jgi:hypothetical protein